MAQQSNRIDEVIVTTISTTGEVHAAPMGIIRQQQVLIQPFQSSTTYHHLKQSQYCIVNMVDDVRIFAGALTNRRDWPTVNSQSGKAAYLRDAVAHIELKRVDFIDQQPRAKWLGDVVDEQHHRAFQGFNRAQAAVIEGAILVSRLSMLPREKLQQELSYLQIAIDKTAGEKEREAWQWLMEKIATIMPDNNG